MPYVYLLVAIVGEVVGTSFMKQSDGYASQPDRPTACRELFRRLSRLPFAHRALARAGPLWRSSVR